eukprot:gene7138-9739_t
MVCGIDVVQPQVLLTFGGCLSLVCHSIIFLLYFYYKIPNLRRHPTTLTIHKSMFEVLFVSQYLWLFSVPRSFLWLDYNNYIEHDVACVVNPIVWPFAWITQFSLLGGELWFGVLSLDIHIALTNPFTSYRINAVFYTRTVYILSIITATILVVVVPIQYGVSSDPMIWIADEVDIVNKANVTKVMMFYLWMILIYGYCGYIAVWAKYQISKGLEETLKMRQYSVNKQTTYVAGYFMFWTFVFTFQFLNYLNSNVIDFLSPGNQYDFSSVSGFLLASRGVWSLGIFLIANWYEIFDFFATPKRLPGENNQTIEDGLERSYSSFSRSFSKLPPPPPEEEERVQLNIALQKEIVKFTSLGIQKAVMELQNRANLEAFDSNRSSSVVSSIFSTRMPGEYFSFVVTDHDSLKKYKDSFSDMMKAELRIASVEEQVMSPIGQSLESNSSANAKLSEGRNSTHSHGSHKSTKGKLSINSLKIDEIESKSPVGSPIDKSRLESADNPRNVALIGQGSSTGYNLSEPSHNSVQSSQSSLDIQDGDSRISAKLLNNLKALTKIVQPPRNNFQFTDFSPKRFANIRKLCGITSDSYIESFKSTTLPSFSEGKSGAFLYFSSDKKYIIKTTTEIEFKKLLSILPDFEKYLDDEYKRWHKPLITRFLGAHRIIMYDIPLYFVVMLNVCPSKVDEKFDLKGSWVNRHGTRMADAKGRRPKKNTGFQSQKQKSGTPLFLDNDIQSTISLRPDIAIAIARQINNNRFNLMDYSLLIGVRRRNFQVFDLQSSSAIKTPSSSNNMIMQTPTTGDTMSTISTNNINNNNINNSNNNIIENEGTPNVTHTTGMDIESAHYNPLHQDVDGAFHAAVVEGQGTFYIGLIDILQEWNWKKWFERTFKIYFLQKDGEGLSAINAKSYRNRFFQRVILDLFEFVEDIPDDELCYSDIPTPESYNSTDGRLSHDQHSNNDRKSNLRGSMYQGRSSLHLSMDGSNSSSNGNNNSNNNGNNNGNNDDRERDNYRMERRLSAASLGSAKTIRLTTDQRFTVAPIKRDSGVQN